jgi:hypothetical protein
VLGVLGVLKVLRVLRVPSYVRSFAGVAERGRTIATGEHAGIRIAPS